MTPTSPESPDNLRQAQSTNGARPLTDEELADCGLLSELDDGTAGVAIPDGGQGNG